MFEPVDAAFPRQRIRQFALGPIRADALAKLGPESFPWLRKRPICVGSFIIGTEPLGEELAREIIPKARLASNS